MEDRCPPRSPARTVDSQPEGCRQAECVATTRRPWPAKPETNLIIPRRRRPDALVRETVTSPPPPPNSLNLSPTLLRPVAFTGFDINVRDESNIHAIVLGLKLRQINKYLLHLDQGSAY
jgi:hypothetical protein